MSKLNTFVAIPKNSHFYPENLPYGVFEYNGKTQIGVAIGEEILNLSYLEEKKLLKLSESCFNQVSLNRFMAQGPRIWAMVRARLQELLADDNSTLKSLYKDRSEPCFVKQADAKMLMPVEIGDYTDFYSSKEHATNVGTMFRDKNNPLLPNWTQIPIAYHGRASSVIVSGTPVKRPRGQIKPSDDAPPVYSPTKRLDYELEMAYFIGMGNDLSQPINIDEAIEHVFGMVIMNDWTARDIQKWEYVPLGPFVSKSFATSISPWVVTMEALKPFRCKGPAQDPTPLAYLQEKGSSHFNIELGVELVTVKGERSQLSKSNTKTIYWSIAQQIAQHTVAGCNLRTGDLLASGTISGTSKDSLGCLLELTWGGQTPVKLSDGQTRTFLEDGDNVVMTAVCRGEGYNVGFGEVSGQIVG